MSLLLNALGDPASAPEALFHVVQKHPYITAGIVLSVFLVVFYYFYEYQGVRSMDQFIEWLASWPIWIIREIMHFYLVLFQNLIKGIKDIVMDFVHGIMDAFKF
jgi:hypothetical protein